jgi:spore coat protein JB
MNMQSNNRVHELAFALYETALYLDGHPNDRRALEYYKKMKERYEKVLAEYEQKYGPITLGSDAAIKNGKWEWVNTPWPWQNEKFSR